jgi:PPOX class probable FMN-dependent enzyme
MDGFGTTIDAPSALRDHYRRPAPLVLEKSRPALDQHSRAFIERSPFVLVATTGADGTVDVTPRGGPAGFVRVLDDHRLLLGDLPGNNRLDSLTNIVETASVGLLFLIPGVDETVRVNGAACVTVEVDLLAIAALDGRLPKAAIGVRVEEAFFHCAKAFRRSSLWDPAAWPSTEGLASLGCVLADQLEALRDVPPAAIDADLEAGYAATLWHD